MIKKISMFVFACLLVVSVGSVMAAEKPAPAVPSSKAAPAAESMMKTSGTVEKVDLKTHTLTINTGTETKNYTFGSSTVYMQGGKKVKSSHLKVGDKVDIFPDSKNMLHKIEIESSSTTH